MSLLAPPINADKYLDVLKLNHIPEDNIAFFKRLLSLADRVLIADFFEGAEITRLVNSRAWFIEQILLQLWKIHITDTKVSLVAVGGFGRGELHPYSDIDLLILTPRNHTKTNDQVSEFIQSLWDIGLDVGHSVRTAKQCYKMAKKDITIATNLMEARYMTGHKKRFDRMWAMVSAKKIWKGAAFFEAKWQEQKHRHKKFSDTTYNLEPNIKEGLGGLRDIQMVSWVAQRFFATQSLHELVDSGFLTEYEYIHLIKGQIFLWRVRFALHIIAKRKEERILFDHQLKLAEVFGFTDVGRKNPAVEQFMQIFYRNAMRLERLNLRLLQLFDETILKETHQNAVININERFHIVNHFLEIKDINLFHQQQTVWFELFLLLQQHPKIRGVRADTVRAMRHNIHLIDDSFRQNPTVKKQFLTILQQDKKVAAVFNQMNQLDILAKYLPVFGRIVGRMQFDLFHIYTVDQHSLFVLRNLCSLRHGKTQVSQAQAVFAEIPKPYLVYIAALFHDIAKGREGSHAELGAIDAENFCDAHGINIDDKALIVWLVKDHLIMSETAQKRDLSDPQTIEKFAKSTQSLLRLQALYLLTIADISATDPKLWNSFKESLLQELFVKTKRYLTTNQSSVPLTTIKQNLSDKLLAQDHEEHNIESCLVNFPDEFIHRVPQKALQKICNLVVNEKTPIVACLNHQPTQKNSKNNDPNTPSHMLDFLVYCPDFKGLFYMMASTLEKYHFDVVDANINITKDHFALNTVKCMTNEPKDTLTQMTLELKGVLAAKQMHDIVINKYTPQRERAFKITPRVEILESHVSDQSLIEVICQDSHGLLARIAKTFYSLGISINAAKIINVGTRAEYIFWLSKKQQTLTTKHLSSLQKNLLERL